MRLFCFFEHLVSVARFLITELLDFKAFFQSLLILARMVFDLLAARTLELDHVVLAHSFWSMNARILAESFKIVKHYTFNF